MPDAAYLIRLSVKPECVEPFRAHTLDLMRAAQRHEACSQVQLLQGDADPSQFVLLESWTDEGFFLCEAHQQADYRNAYFEATKSMLRDVHVELLRPVVPTADAIADDAADAGTPVA